MPVGTTSRAPRTAGQDLEQGLSWSLGADAQGSRLCLGIALICELHGVSSLVGTEVVTVLRPHWSLEGTLGQAPW